MPRPPLLDLDLMAAREAAAKAIRESPHCIELSDEDTEALAAEAVDAVLKVLVGCGDYSTWWGCHCTRTGEHDLHGCRCGTTWKGDGERV